MESPEIVAADGAEAFHVELDNFSGPFDLLLGLISKRQLDITEVALAQVTDEFIAYMHDATDLSQTSEFLVVAATLLDMKARSLLPRDETDDGDDDYEYLEARDLLFARLLLYRAFKQAAAILGGLEAANAGVRPRAAALEARFAQLLPEIEWDVTPDMLAALAVDVFTRTPPQVTTTHLHDPLVPVRPQAEYLLARLRECGRATFIDLCRTAPDLNTVVSRFLALLDLFRQGIVTFDQSDPATPLTVVWSGREVDTDDLVIDADHDPEDATLNTDTGDHTHTDSRAHTDEASQQITY